MKARFAVAAVLCVFGVGTASAQSTLGFGVMAGGSFALGDLKPYDAGSTGWHVGGVVNWKNVLSPISVRGSLVYDDFGTGEKPSSQGGGPATGQVTYFFHQLKSFSGTADVVWNAAATAGAMSPYVMGGLGVYQLRPCTQIKTSTTTSVSGTTSDCDADPNATKAGANIGAGVNLPLTGFKVGVEATYHYVFGTVESLDGNASFARLSVVLNF